MAEPIDTSTLGPIKIEAGRSGPVGRLAAALNDCLHGYVEHDDFTLARNILEKSGLISSIAELEDLLADNLEAWEGEEDSVKEEHADLIERLQKFELKL